MEHKTKQKLGPNQMSKIYEAQISDDASEGSEDESSELVHISDISDSETPKLSLSFSGNKSPPKQHKKPDVSEFKMWLNTCVVLGLGITLLGIGIAYLVSFPLDSYKSKEKMLSSPKSDPQEQTMQFLVEMQNSFPKQTRETWISFLSALTNLMDEEPSQPAVLLFIGQNNAVDTMQCVAKQLAVTTNKLFSSMNSAADYSTKVFIQVNDIVRLQKQDEAIKEELDIQMQSILNQSYSVVLGPLEDIPPRAALLLHGYCDNFMAPFKKRVIILTATFGPEKPVSSKQVDRRLRGLWDPKLGPDKSASLVSRVANNVVFIEPESEKLPCANRL